MLASPEWSEKIPPNIISEIPWSACEEWEKMSYSLKHGCETAFLKDLFFIIMQETNSNSIFSFIVQDGLGRGVLKLFIF